MAERGNIASASDIETARKLLVEVILGMAYWLKHRSEAFERELDTTEKAVTSKLQTLRVEFTALSVDGVKVPDAQSEQEYSQLKVRIVNFCDVSDTEHHPAPDPLLLAVRAAATWSRRHGQPLKAAAEPQDEEEEEDELSVMAEEQFLERRRNSWRPKTLDDLARGLGQPFGYQQQEGETKE
jgi:preprotein translocase subunit SecD